MESARMADTHPRVLNVISRLVTGGAESLLYYIHKHMSSLGYTRFVICTLTTEGDFYRKAREDNLPLTSLGLSSSYDPRALLRLTQVIKQGDFNIVHSHLSSACLYSFLASFFIPDVKLIHTTHGVDTVGPEHDSMLTGLRYRIFASRIAKIVAVSEHTKSKYINLTGIDESKVVVIPNAIEPYQYQADENIGRQKAQLGIADNTPVLLAVGRICEQKGYDVLLKAARILKEQGQPYKLLIAGDGPLWSEMNKQSCTLDLQAEVCFLGRRNDVPQLLRMADIFVQSSNWEGMSISIIEAMMCGKPIVATAVDGTCELIKSEVDGLLVPPQDPSSLATTIAKMLKDSRMCLKLGENARKRSYKEFTMDVMARRLIELYENLLYKGCEKS